MQDRIFFFIVVAAVLIVAVILMIGIGTFGRGGEFNRRNGNRFMRWRIYGQAIAIALILIYITLVRH